jgi:hypothetical protein
VVDQPTAGVSAYSGSDREGKEAQSCRQRSVAKDVLQVERAEQEESEEQSAANSIRISPPPTARSASRLTWSNGSSVTVVALGVFSLLPGH